MSRRPSGQHQLNIQVNVHDNKQAHQSIAAVQNEDEVSTEQADDEMYTSQVNDEVIGPILHAKETGTKPRSEKMKGEDRAVHILLQQWDQLLLHNGLLYRRFEKDNGNFHLQLVILKSKQEGVLSKAHAGPWGGHLEEKNQRLKERFYWPGYSQSVKEWCQTCPNCAARKNSAHRYQGALKNIRSGYPKQIIAMDIMGPSQKPSREIVMF